MQAGPVESETHHPIRRHVEIRGSNGAYLRTLAPGPQTEIEQQLAAPRLHHVDHGVAVARAGGDHGQVVRANAQGADRSWPEARQQVAR
jgi:hypothetical protein